MAVTVISEHDRTPASVAIKNAVVTTFKRDDYYWIVVGDDYCEVAHVTESLSHEEFWNQSPRKVIIDGHQVYLNVVFYSINALMCN